MSEIPEIVNTVFSAMRTARESETNRKLRGKRHEHVRALVGELNAEGVDVSDDALDILKACVKEPPGPAEDIDLLCPEPDQNAGVIDFKEVWQTVHSQKLAFVQPRDAVACLRKYRDRLTPVDFTDVMFADKPGSVCQLLFFVDYQTEPWILLLGVLPHGGLYLGAEPLRRGLVAGSMFPIRRPH